MVAAAEDGKGKGEGGRLGSKACAGECHRELAVRRATLLRGERGTAARASRTGRSRGGSVRRWRRRAERQRARLYKKVGHSAYVLTTNNTSAECSDWQPCGAQRRRVLSKAALVHQPQIFHQARERCTTMSASIVSAGTLGHVAAGRAGRSVRRSRNTLRAGGRRLSCFAMAGPSGERLQSLAALRV